MRQECHIVSIGNRRNSKPRWWCRTHRAAAWDSKGEKLERCPKADLPRPGEQAFLVDPADYEGGLAGWGAVDPIYDTTEDKPDRGIHLHARLVARGPKVIDQTFPALRIKLPCLLGDDYIEIDERAAVAYMVGTLLGRKLAHLHCTHCGNLHLDAGWFSVHPHRKHQCNTCGREFFDSERGFSNPLVLVKELYEVETERQTSPANRKLTVRQKDYPGGVRIWASNPAIFWTQAQQEESGVHVHCYDKDGRRVVDDTYDWVEVDGLFLDDEMARFYMAQRELPHLQNRLVSLSCSECGQEHFGKADDAIYPHREHRCQQCGSIFRSPKKVVSNPIVHILEELRKLR